MTARTSREFVPGWYASTTTGLIALGWKWTINVALSVLGFPMKLRQLDRFTVGGADSDGVAASWKCRYRRQLEDLRTRLRHYWVLILSISEGSR